ncbi:MAG: alpha/beta fold hydrolase, partial [Nitrospinota bacterium]|nr:alpha/beta fold hydrolase [Nitrospinota bacterium]
MADGGGGKNYVLVHGSCHGAFCWEEVIKHMEKQGKRAYALDLPGHGDRIPERPNVRYDDYPNAVVEFIEGRDLNNVVLVGLAIAILWGTLYPMFSEWLTGTKRTVGPPWYDMVTRPL